MNDSRQKKLLLYAFFFVFTFWLSSCKESSTNIEPTPTNTYLVSTNLIGSYTINDLKTRTAVLTGGINDPLVNAFVTGLVKYDIKAYKIVYKTKNTDGTEVQVSGALLIPTTTEAVPLISQQHGTIRSDTDAPSNYGTGSESYSIASLFASNGYIIACPDYIGYGTSKNIVHPYEHRESLAQASLDMIRASAEFIKQEKVNWNKKLMITGYSQGGFATMSLQKKIEEQFPNEFNLVASSCGAGAYNKTAFMKYLMNETTHGIAAYNQLYIWVVQTYNRVYGLNRTMDAYFKAPYAADIQANGTNTDVSVSFNLAFSDSFKKAVNDGTDTAFLNAVKDNDVYDWGPKTETQLYHGDADQQVFYLNSTTAVAAMKAKGGNVTLYTTIGGTHGSTLQSYALGTFQFFNSKK
ncbi:alpha/beta hydrolase family protein [Arcicella rigui]|uniref:Lipase family protein n=1 Tax=Arcicella rigui TaxID=797020 RepID=A0ABU5QAJ4_9BACT|nr:lipase family protein [Arcicella rigui]MEA5139879.1 lipase family protein [Arcicella rigui]